MKMKMKTLGIAVIDGYMGSATILGSTVMFRAAAIVAAPLLGPTATTIVTVAGASAAVAWLYSKSQNSSTEVSFEVLQEAARKAADRTEGHIKKWYNQLGNTFAELDKSDEDGLTIK